MLRVLGAFHVCLSRILASMSDFLMNVVIRPVEMWDSRVSWVSYPTSKACLQALALGTRLYAANTFNPCAQILGQY